MEVLLLHFVRYIHGYMKSRAVGILQSRGGGMHGPRKRELPLNS